MSSRPDILIEVVRMGRMVRVTACDPVSLEEVSVVGSAITPLPMLERTAMRKLQDRLAKDSPGARDPAGRGAGFRV